LVDDDTASAGAPWLAHLLIEKGRNKKEQQDAKRRSKFYKEFDFQEDKSKAPPSLDK
jgi:hypothetical protein